MNIITSVLYIQASPTFPKKLQHNPSVGKFNCFIIINHLFPNNFMHILLLMQVLQLSDSFCKENIIGTFEFAFQIVIASHHANFTMLCKI